jgi:hypothetical protein
MVTHGNREAINHRDSIAMEHFPGLSSKVEYDDKYLFHTVQSSTKAALPQQVRHVAVLLEHKCMTKSFLA